MLKLQAGRFYKSKAGDVWCCYHVDSDVEADDHAAAHCVTIFGTRTEYFYADGRYDADGKREHTLVEECGPDGGLTPHQCVNKKKRERRVKR